MRNLKKMMLGIIGMFVCAGLMAQSVVTHTVQRGETLESIAAEYGLTEKALLEANPNAKNFFYVGAKLTIPAKSENVPSPAPVQTVSETGTVKQTVIEPTKQVEKVTTPVANPESVVQVDSPEGYVDDSKEGTWEGAFDAFSFGFDGSGGFDLVFKSAFGANYWITDKVYAGAKIGYCNMLINGDGWNHESHFIALPLELGVTLLSEDQKWGIAPFVGLDFNIGITGKTDYDNNDYFDDVKHKIGGKVGVGACIGLQFVIYKVVLAGTYHTPLNEKQEGFFGQDGYFSISLCAGF